MIDGNNSQLLEESSPEIQEIWNRIEETGYVPEIHSIIRAYFLNIQNRYYPGLVFFVDEDGIYVSPGNYYAPDKFYDLLERLGLGEDFDRYIYRNSGPNFRRNKWPYTTHYMKKL